MTRQFFGILCLLCIFFAHGHADSALNLSKFERKIFSQNGEDGVTLKIFETIGTTSKYFVEFGVQNGIECNTRYLREMCNWQGLMMDAGYSNALINLRQERITAENINLLFEKYNVPYEFDLLSIDIDYNDFHVWHAINERYRPRVIIMEYNSTHLPHEDKVSQYDPNLYWDGSNYFGGSILAFYKLARKKGYSLVYADNRGVNLFFIRDDVLEQCSIKFKDVNSVERIYKYPRYGAGPNGGHTADWANRQYISADELLKDHN